MTSIYLASSLRPVHSVTPGSSVTAEIVLENRGTRATAVRLYLSDFRTDAQGESHYEPPGTLPRSNADWILLSRSEVQLDPGERLAIPYYIQVPRLADMSGSYWSVIMAEPQDGTAVSHQDLGNGARAGVRTVFRYAITVLTNLEGGQAQLGFEAPQLLYDPATHAYTMSLRLTNPGVRMLQPQVWLELYNTRGELAGRFEGVRDRVFPGSALLQSFDLGSLPEGAYQAVVIADAGSEEIFAVRYTLNLTADTP